MAVMERGAKGPAGMAPAAARWDVAASDLRRPAGGISQDTAIRRRGELIDNLLEKYYIGTVAHWVLSGSAVVQSLFERITPGGGPQGRQ